MSSLIDPTKPASPIARTRDVRDNFQHAKEEIEALQLNVAQLLSSFGNSPAFTGTATFEDIDTSGNVVVSGNLAVGLGVYSYFASHGSTVTLTAAAGVSNFAALVKVSDLMWNLYGVCTNSSGGGISSATNILNFLGILNTSIVASYHFPAVIYGAATTAIQARLRLVQAGGTVNVNLFTVDAAGAAVNWSTAASVAFNLLLQMDPP